MKSYNDYLQLVEEAISRLDIEGHPAVLFDAVRYAMEAGGKRLRPVLTMAVADAVCGDLTDAVPGAMAVEMFHNFTLVHDDIMDHSDTRRGRPTVAARYGEATAILVGDTMLTFATNLPIQAEEMHPEKRLQMVALLNRVAVDVYRGQQLDMDMEKAADVSLEQYVEMVSLKTAALLSGAVMLGVVAASGSETLARAFQAYAHNLGIAFQMQDDLLDTFGTLEQLGKPIGGDISNDKNTWLRIVARTEAPERLARADSLEGEAKYQAVRLIYAELGLPERGEKIISAYTDAAVKALRDVGLADDAIAFFTTLAHNLLKRNK